ncbi:hypothetical protein QE152_g10217 [Popillia japonica]|uniref:Phosphatidylinositol glycan anchor biosynthesis class U protein n=1 Tax=Popillia japonica TaxID=7064 RepID=A0AAW1LVX0_POPJA
MKSHLIIYGLAIFVRVFLIYSDYRENIADRIEISTPLNSFNRILESYYRMSIGVDPYSSDVLHESPLHLHFYKHIIENTGQYLPLVFVFCDVLTAYLLYLFAKKYILNLRIEQYINMNLYLKHLKDQMLNVSDNEAIPLYVTVMYLFNPYIIFNCVACTTTTFLNLCLATFLYAICSGSVIIGAVSLAIASLQSLYPVILISALYLSVLKYQNSMFKAVISVISCISLLVVFIFSSYYLMGSWNFIPQTYGFILQVSDQQPNIGIYWYFFMEMFEHFKELFICSYQINVTILYFIPLTIKFRKDPVLLGICFIMLTGIFKSYPSIGDFGFSLALLPVMKYMYNCMQQIFVSIVAIITTTTLAPILWNLWIYWGSANANFFFGTTLAFITAHIFILTDVSFAHSKHDYLLKYGNDRTINGQPAKLVLG